MFIYFLYGQVSLDLESLYFKPQFSSLFSHAGSANLLSAGGTLAQVPRSPVSSGDASPPHVLVEGALLRCWNMSTGASFSEARDSWPEIFCNNIMAQLNTVHLVYFYMDWCQDTRWKWKSKTHTNVCLQALLVVNLTRMCRFAFLW